MQIRLDPDNARIVKRNADAHRRLFKRRKSHAAFVNEVLRDRFRADKTVKDISNSAKTVFGWTDKK